MAAKTKTAKSKAKTKKRGMTLKQRLWLKAFLNRDNPSTFLNRSESARVAGYNCDNEDSYGQIGAENFKKLGKEIAFWIEDDGLGENQLKGKLISLIDAKQVTFHKVKGKVDLASLPHGAFIVAASSIMGWSGQGEEKEPVDEGDTIICLPTAALETQRKSLEMAMKIKGMFAPEKHEVKHSVNPWKDVIETVTKPNTDELPNRGNREVQG